MSPISLHINDLPLQVLMVRMISTEMSSHHCKPSSPFATGRESDCNFFLMAIRLASLNQILDPWVYLLLREILLRKFCMAAVAMSNCSLGERRGQVALVALNALNKESSPEVDQLQKQQKE